MRPGGRQVHPGSLGSLMCALGVVGFIRGRWVHWGAPWGRRIYPGSLDSMVCALGSSGSSAVVRFTGMRPERRRVHPGSLGCRTPMTPDEMDDSPMKAAIPDDHGHPQDAPQ